jgi:membrane-bound serine protease (ClpP class)
MPVERSRPGLLSTRGAPRHALPTDGPLTYDRTMIRSTLYAFGLTALLMLGGAAASDARSVWYLELDGAIGPASADYIIRSIGNAEEANAELFVIRLDTPGGLDSSMRDIIRVMLGARIPVAIYVAPSGARAASAGAYMLYASHIAAMAPATNVGSATPVQIGGGGPFPSPEDDAPRDDDEDADDERPRAPRDATERKAIEDAVAYIKGLAELRGRNVELAERMVRDAANVSASEALRENVIEYIAADLDDLLQQLDGQTIHIDGQTEVVLDLAEVDVNRLEPGWRYEFLSLITNPNVAYILLMIGLYGLILEFYNPGVGVAGVTGIICLLLGAYALQMLPINYVGLALIIVGIGLMLLEAFSPSFGVFGIGGAISFIIGSIILMDTDLPAYQISLPVVAAFAAVSVAIAVFSVGAALRARQGRIVSGTEGMIGGTGQALTDFPGHGRVRTFGETWQARCDFPVKRGETVRIKGMDGLVLEVEPMNRKSEE